jgi:hypothetical protein
MPGLGFEPMIPVFEWVKTVHALDRAATVISPIYIYVSQMASSLQISQTTLSNIIVGLK